MAADSEEVLAVAAAHPGPIALVTSHMALPKGPGGVGPLLGRAAPRSAPRQSRLLPALHRCPSIQASVAQRVSRCMGTQRIRFMTKRNVLLQIR